MDTDAMFTARRAAVEEEARGYRLRLDRAVAAGDDETAAAMRRRLDHVNEVLGVKAEGEPVQRRPRKATEKRA